MTRENIPPREDILRMSREAGLNMGTIQQYERFTQLVANALAALQSAALRKELDHIPDAGKMVGPERQPLPDDRVKALLRIGPVYAPDGLVTRTGAAYRKELHEAALWGWRCAEGAYGIKEQP